MNLKESIVEIIRADDMLGYCPEITTECGNECDYHKMKVEFQAQKIIDLVLSKMTRRTPMNINKNNNSIKWYCKGFNQAIDEMRDKLSK